MSKGNKRPPVSAPRPPGDLNPRSDPALDFPDREFGEMTPADYRRWDSCPASRCTSSS